MSKKIRVLHVVTGMERGGIENFLMNIYRNIDRDIIQFDFLDHSQKEEAFDQEIIELGGKIFKFNKLSSKYFFRYQKDLKDFFAIHRRYNIIHSHLNLLSAFTLKGAKKAGIPTRIAHSHSNSFSNTGIKKLIKNYAKTQINKYTTDRFACSKKAGIWQFGRKQWEQGNIKIINNAIDIDKFQFSKTDRQKIRKELNLKDDELLFGHSGKFKEVKNHKFLIEIFSKIKEQNSKGKLILIGAGELQNEIRDMVKKLNLEDSIFFTGNTRVSNVNNFLCAIDCFIFPSFFEGLGISLIEAQVCGLLCFASDCIPSEAKISEKTHFISLKNNSNFWANTILEKINNTNLYERNLPKLANNFDIKKITKELEDFYIKKTGENK